MIKISLLKKDFPLRHQKNNYALKCGVKHQLLINAKAVTLKEI